MQINVMARHMQTTIIVYPETTAMTSYYMPNTVMTPHYLQTTVVAHP